MVFAHNFNSNQNQTFLKSIIILMRKLASNMLLRSIRENQKCDTFEQIKRTTDDCSNRVMSRMKIVQSRTKEKLIFS